MRALGANPPADGFPRISRRRLRQAGILVLITLAIGVAEPVAMAEIKKTGALNAPAGAALMAFCSDPTVEHVLSDDLRAAKRAASSDAQSVLTLTVTVSQQLLKPGVSLGQVAPGDPQVAELLKSAGATPPPIGDTGVEIDKGAVARQRMAANMGPMDSPMQSFLNQFKTEGDLGPQQNCSDQRNPQPGCVQATPQPKVGTPGYTGDVADYLHQDPTNRGSTKLDDSAYDTVLVARASLGGSPDELTVVAVVHPGEDVGSAKELVAEAIANALLH